MFCVHLCLVLGPLYMPPYRSALAIAHAYIRNISMPAGIVSRLWEEKTEGEHDLERG